MTVQAGIEVETDLATLVGEFEEQACEHSQHGTHHLHNDEPASHYIRAWCDCDDCGPSIAYAACPSFVAFALSSQRNMCPLCGYRGRANEMFEVLGPINSFTR